MNVRADVAIPFEPGAIGVASDEERAWDAFVARSPDAHHEQTSGFARQRARHGFEVVRATLRREGRIVAGAQMLIHEVPALGRLGVVQQGPILDASAPREATSKAVLDALERVARERGVVRVRLDAHSGAKRLGGALAGAGYVASDAWWWNAGESCVMPVQRTDDAILDAMSTSGRRGVRTAERRGVVVAEGARADLVRFHALQRLTAAHQRFPLFPVSYLEYVWDLLATSGKAKLLLATVDGEAIAGILVTLSGGVAYYGWGGMSRAKEHAELRPNYALHFRAMQIAREWGAETYDLAGTSEFKRKLAASVVPRPKPFDRYLGTLANVRRATFENAWSRPSARRFVRSFVHRYYGPMPY